MKVTWTNNVRNTFINREDECKKQEKKAHSSAANQSQVADKANTVVINFEFLTVPQMLNILENILVKSTKERYLKKPLLTKKKDLRSRSAMQ